MRNNQKCQKCFGTGRVFMAGGPTQQCDCFITNPAPKEEEMIRSDYRIGINGTCPKCGRRLTTTYCTNCTVGQPLGGGFLPRKEEAYERRTAERRAVAREAYMAALGTLGEYTAYSDLVTDCQTVALETVRRWDAFMAAVDAEGGE